MYQKAEKGSPAVPVVQIVEMAPIRQRFLCSPLHYVKRLEMAMINSFFKQRAKKVVSDSPGLVDFAIKLLG